MQKTFQFKPMKLWPPERQIMKDQILDCLAAIAIGAVFAILLAWRG